MKKDKKISIRTAFISLMCSVAIGQHAGAQPAAFTTKDSISSAIHIDILKNEFLIAGDLYKIKKYRLERGLTTNPDSLLQQSMIRYNNLFAALPEKRQQHFFSDDFYNEVIPVVQYFRNAHDVDQLMEHHKALHPKAPVPDPKHHDESVHSDSGEHKHLHK